MKEIDLQTAYAFLEQSPALVCEGRLLEPTLMGLSSTNDEDHEFMFFSWQEEFEGKMVEVEVAFAEGDNVQVELNGSKLMLTSTTGLVEELTLLKEFVAEEL
jgi:hypothetical protein